MRLTIFVFAAKQELGRQIAFLKSSATQAAQDTARDAVQLFGGRGITQSGMGRFIEHVSPHLLLRILKRVDIFFSSTIESFRSILCLGEVSLKNGT